jgi:aspartate/glutamate racemase
LRALQRAGNWATIARAGQGLVEAGADVLLICTNTMHLCVPALEKAVRVPVLHIADPLGEAITAAGLSRVGLLGTKFTMERPEVSKGRLTSRFDLDILTPDGENADEVHRIIFAELCCGRFLETSRARLAAIIAGLAAQGAQGIILGCTEIPLLVTARCRRAAVRHHRLARSGGRRLRAGGGGAQSEPNRSGRHPQEHPRDVVPGRIENRSRRARRKIIARLACSAGVPRGRSRRWLTTASKSQSLYRSTATQFCWIRLLPIVNNVLKFPP